MRILDTRMKQIDRQQNFIYLEADSTGLIPENTILPYDYLVIACGMQDNALHTLGLRSWGSMKPSSTPLSEKQRAIEGVGGNAENPAKILLGQMSMDVKAEIQAANNEGGQSVGLENNVMNGALSIGDPNLGTFLATKGTFIKSLIWNPLCYAVVYGNSMDAYNAIQGLLVRNVPPTKIVLLIPPAAGGVVDGENGR